MKELETSNNKLTQENDLLYARVAILERKVDQGEQYRRRNCLRISGVYKARNIMQPAAAIDADVNEAILVCKGNTKRLNVVGARGQDLGSFVSPFR